MKAKKTERINIIVVDNEVAVRSSLASALNEHGYNVTCFDNSKDCLKKFSGLYCHLMIAHVNVPKMNGFELLTDVKRIIPSLPVIMTGYGSIRTAVEAVKLGASDFIEKPFDIKYVISKVEETLDKYEISGISDSAPLNDIQKKILKLILDGKSNKQVAASIERSIRTVEHHKHNIMKKFQADSLPELVKKALSYVD